MIVLYLQKLRRWNSAWGDKFHDQFLDEIQYNSDFAEMGKIALFSIKRSSYQ